VRTLNAPPRRNRAPLDATTSAVSKICARDSTAQGPAITTSSGPPIAQSLILTARTLLIGVSTLSPGAGGSARRGAC